MSVPFGGRYPIRFLQIELSSRCNLSCVECPHRTMQRKPKDLQEEVLEAVIDRILRPYRMDSVVVSMSGEPLLNRRFCDVLTRISEVHSGAYECYTNAIHYTLQHHQFLAGLPNHTRLLMTHHLYGADGRRVNYDAASAVLLECLQNSVPNVEYILATHATPMAPEEELQAWHAYWQKVGTRYPSLSAVHLNRAVQTWAGKVEGNTQFSACVYAVGSHLFIGATGNALPCCVDMEEELAFGNILTDPLEVLMERRAVFYDTIGYEAARAPLCCACLPPGDYIA